MDQQQTSISGGSVQPPVAISYPGERPPDVVCSGGFRLPSLAVLIGRQLGQGQGDGE